MGADLNGHVMRHIFLKHSGRVGSDLDMSCKGVARVPGPVLPLGAQCVGPSVGYYRTAKLVSVYNFKIK